MSVEAFTVDGKVTLNTEDFDSAISNLVRKLDELKNGLSNLGIHTTNFTNELSVVDKQFDDIKGSANGVESEVKDIINSVNEATNSTNTLNSELSVAKETVSALSNATSTLVYDFGQFTTEVGKATEQVQILTNEFSSMRYYVDMAKADETALLQIEQKRIDALTKLQSDESKRIQHLHNIIDYLHMEEQQMEANASIQRDIIARLEREEQKRQEIMQKTLNMAKRELSYLEQQHQAELKIYDDIVRRYEAQGRFVTGIQEELGLLAERNATEEQELIHLDNQLMLQKSINTLVNQGGAENIKSAEALLKQLDTDTNIYHILEKEIMAEKEKLALLEEQDAVLKKQTADREKQLVSSQKGNKLDKMGYLPSRIGSMALTMWGFNEIMDIYEKSSSNLNARGSQKYFSEALQTDQRYLNQTKQSSVQVRTEMSKLGDQLDALQKKYQKIDMTVVGANAEETAYKYGLQADKIGDLSEVMAIYGSEFVKQGRSQEDSILALNDALDGELRRLKEVNVGKEELEAHGWTGDQASMIDALKEIADERGYTLTAQNITNLNDAIETLELKISRDLVDAFEYIQPILIEVAKDFVIILEALEGLVGYLNEIWKKVSTRLDIMFGVQNMQKFGDISTKVIGGLITGLIGLYIIKKVASAFKSGWNTILDVLGKTKPIDKASDSLGKLGGSTNTGGTSAPKEGGGFKDGIKGLAKNLGKMAKVFVEVAVAIAMAWALIEEAIILISAIGYTYDSLKPQFDSGIEFIKEFGLWFALLGGALLVFSYALGKVPESAMQTVTKGATKLAYGMAIAIGLVTEAIGLLIAPMLAIALLGGTASLLGTNLDKGLEVISWIGNALHQIDLPVALFIGGFLAVSLLLGLVQPLTLALAVGIASALLLVTEAIVMLIPPLGAIALLGGTASMLGQDKIQQGADALKIVGQALKTIAEAVPYLLVVDIGVLGQELMDWGSKLITGKDGLTYLSEEIIPNLSTFVESFNNATINPINETTVANLSQVASQLPTIKSAIDTIRTSVGNGGTGGINVFGFQIGGDTSSLKPKLDALYQDIKDVIDFANKFGEDGGSLDSVSAVTQMASAISQLQLKLSAMVTTITTASVKVKSASKQMGSAIKVGFKEGSSGFESSVINVVASGIDEVKSRYNTWKSGGTASANKLAEGFSKLGGKLKSSISTEMGYALDELDNYKDDFYNKGAMLGQSLVDGFKSKKALDQNSPAKITKSIREELGYSMEALNTGKQMMYQGGVALGQALTNGYNSYGNLRTDVGVLAQKGVSNEQLQANAKSVQGKGKGNQKTPQLTQTNINIDMSNSTVIGVQDLDNKIRQAVEKAIVSINSPNGAIGY